MNQNDVPPSTGQRERLLQERGSGSRVGTWNWNLETDEFTWSNGCYQVLGLEPEQCAPSLDSFVERVHPDDQVRARQQAQEVKNGLSTPALPYRILRPDGLERRVRVESEPGPGLPRRVVGTIVDVTEQELQIEAHERTLSLLRSAQQQAHLGTWTWNLATDIVQWSDQMYRMFRYDPATFQPTLSGSMERVHPEDRPRVEAITAEALRRGIVAPHEFRFLRGDGTYAHVWSTGQVLVDENGQQTLGHGTMLDLSERKALEDELRQSQKMLALGALAGGVAHDFNNHLFVVGGNLEFLEDDLVQAGQLTPGLSESLESARTALSQCAALTRQLLALGQHHAGVTVSLSLDEALRSQLDRLQQVAGPGIQFETWLRAPKGHVRCDRELLEQALVNLVTNAREAMSGSGTIWFETDEVELTPSQGHSALPSGHYLRLRVRDSGAGIAEEHLPRVFDPFFTTKPERQGAGLGLSATYGIVRQFGGHVQVTSEPKQSAEFTVWLPLQRASESPPQSHAAPSLCPGNAEGNLLVVDDEPLVRSTAAALLERAGYLVDQAEGAQSALAALAQGKRYDLILSDILMPRMTGDRLVAEIRARGGTMPIVLMSGFAQPQIDDDTPAASCPRLLKPFRRQQLLKVVRDALGEPKRRVS